ncbi:MAG: EAL domain-containing protein [Hyphomonadaceae bacterium]|nr:EAL domain-containing protein [Hyphomonadaceae bacterium]
MFKARELDLETLLEAIDRLDTVFAVYDKDHRLVFANESARRGWPKLYDGLARGLSQYDATRLEIASQFPNHSEDDIDQFTEYSVAIASSGKHGEIRAQTGRIYRTHHERLGEKGIVGIGVDLTDLKKHEHELSRLAEENFRLANIDELTGLSNRRHFLSRLDELCDPTHVDPKPFVLGLLDLDGFKLVNDVHGHPVGDALLKEAADRLRSAFCENCVIARLGGDEFGIIVPSEKTADIIETTATDICAVLGQPYELDGERLYVSASMGIASFPNVGQTRRQLMERADFALYHAKQNDKGRAIIFSAEHEIRIRRHASLELGIREADLERELYLDFQPILNAQSQIVTSFEALARWNSPTLGAVSPEHFIPIAEQSGLITKLSPILLRRALREAETWPETISLSINLSSLEVASMEHAQQLMRLIDQSSVNPRRVVFEITETAMMRESKNVLKVLEAFRKVGIRISLDDFGTGFSSLNHVAHMPLDAVKIDRTFLEGIETRRESASVLKTICDLCRSLGLTSVMEGVETPLQARMVKSAGIDFMQGYLFCRPISAGQVQKFLTAERLPEKVQSRQAKA